MCSTKLIFVLAISVLLSDIYCTKIINPESTLGSEGICQYPDNCTTNPQLPPPSTYQPYGTPPPPKPVSPPPPSPPPPAPTGYSPYGAAPPPPAGYSVNCPPPPLAPEDQNCCQQSDSPPSPPPNYYTYLNETTTSSAPPPALPSVLSLCTCTTVIYIWLLFAALLFI